MLNFLLHSLRFKCIPKSDNMDQNVCATYHSAFIYAAQRGNLHEVKMHLKANIDVNKANYFGQNALMGAAENGHTDVVNFLIRSTADVNISNIHLSGQRK